MESQKVLNEKIILVTRKIQKDFPELSKYIKEMPEHIIPASHKGVMPRDLRGYLDSLNQLLETYTKEH
jgi:hypothetical protein